MRNHDKTDAGWAIAILEAQAASTTAWVGNFVRLGPEVMLTERTKTGIAAGWEIAIARSPGSNRVGNVARARGAKRVKGHCAGRLGFEGLGALRTYR